MNIINEAEEQMPINNSGSLKGDFVSGAHSTNGECAVNVEKTLLTFTKFKTESAIKLSVYLSTKVNSTDFVDLVDLKGIEGDFDYKIPKSADLKRYKYVVIWCVDFSVSFGHTELK